MASSTKQGAEMLNGIKRVHRFSQGLGKKNYKMCLEISQN